MFSTQRYLIDNEGHWHVFPYNNRLFSKFSEDARFKFEFTLLGIQEMGFVSLVLGSDEIVIRLNPSVCDRKVADEVIGHIATGNPNVPIQLCLMMGGWMNYPFKNIVMAMREFDALWDMSLGHHAADGHAVQYRAISHMPDLPINKPLIDAIGIRRESAGILDMETFEKVQKVTHNRVMVSQLRDGHLEVRHPGSFTFDLHSTDFRIQNQRDERISSSLIDRKYATWVEGTFHAFIQSGQDIASQEVDARIDFDGAGKEWARRRYRRTLLKFQSDDGTPMVMTTSVLDNSIKVA